MGHVVPDCASWDRACFRAGNRYPITEGTFETLRRCEFLSELYRVVGRLSLCERFPEKGYSPAEAAWLLVPAVFEGAAVSSDWTPQPSSVIFWRSQRLTA